MTFFNPPTVYREFHGSSHFGGRRIVVLRVLGDWSRRVPPYAEKRAREELERNTDLAVLIDVTTAFDLDTWGTKALAEHACRLLDSSRKVAWILDARRARDALSELHSLRERSPGVPSFDSISEAVKWVYEGQ